MFYTSCSNRIQLINVWLVAIAVQMIEFFSSAVFFFGAKNILSRVEKQIFLSNTPTGNEKEKTNEFAYPAHC